METKYFTERNMQTFVINVVMLYKEYVEAALGSIGN